MATGQRKPMVFGKEYCLPFWEYSLTPSLLTLSNGMFLKYGEELEVLILGHKIDRQKEKKKPSSSLTTLWWFFLFLKNVIHAPPLSCLCIKTHLCYKRHNPNFLKQILVDNKRRGQPSSAMTIFSNESFLVMEAPIPATDWHLDLIHPYCIYQACLIPAPSRLFPKQNAWYKTWHHDSVACASKQIML